MHLRALPFIPILTKGSFIVNTNTIGIKLGDGSFYPILEEGFKGKKRFVLSTVRDNQESMQIDFYRSSDSSIERSEYIGSLVIDNITPAHRGVPEIEVIIGLDIDNKLHAVAKNLASSEKQSLSVSLETLPEDATYTVPEFEIDEKLEPANLFQGDEEIEEEPVTDDEFTREEEEEEPESFRPKRKPNVVFAVLFVLGGLVVVAGLTFLIWWLLTTVIPGNTGSNISQTKTEKTEKSKETTAKTQKESSTISIKESTKTSKTKEKNATSSKTATTKQTSKQKESTKQKEQAVPGTMYTVKRGDTLWDLSATFYRDPFQWYRIWRHKPNKIKNPDLIFIDQKIFIPEK
jgi:molecular chaperone DnaK (HSP70)